MTRSTFVVAVLLASPVALLAQGARNGSPVRPSIETAVVPTLTPLTMARRPGRPLIDFVGPDLVVGTTNIPAPDRVLPGRV